MSTLSSSPRSSRLRAAALVATALLAATGCTGSSSSAAPDPDSEPSGPSSAIATDDQAFELVGFPSVSAQVPEKPLGSTPSTLPSVELEAYLVERRGAAVTVVFALHNRGGTAAAVGTLLGEEGLFDRTVGGVSLLDPAGLKQYLTLRPADALKRGGVGRSGPCACSSTTFNEVDAGARVYFAASVAAPPDDVEQVSFVTSLGTVPGLTITRG